MAVSSGIIALSSYDVPASEATAYTVGSGIVRFRIDQASVTNYTGTARDLTVYLLQSSDSVVNRTKAVDALNIPANTTVPLFELVGRAIDNTGIINAFASAASALALSVTGTTFT
jgi:hypothetical protein